MYGRRVSPAGCLVFRTVGVIVPLSADLKDSSEETERGCTIAGYIHREKMWLARTVSGEHTFRVTWDSM
jgi:hypothetical protein